jgi:hypothetical protein
LQFTRIILNRNPLNDVRKAGTIIRRGDRLADVLARVADPQGLADRGFATRAQVAAAIAGSHEAHALVVQGLYHKLLLRSADPSGQATWTGFLDGGSTAEQLSAILMGSDEYKNRDVVTPAGFVDAAAMTGALVGAFAGSGAIPTGCWRCWKTAPQGRAYINALAAKLFERHTGPRGGGAAV